MLRGKGMPSLQRSGRGDHRVLVNVSVPRRLTDEQSELLERFEQLSGEDTYRRDGGQWKFQDRLMSYMYYLPIAEYADGLGDGSGSVRAYGDHRPADWPESLQNGGKRNDWL